MWHALAALLTLAPIVWLIVAYPSLPERIPDHFNIHGEPDRWMEKSVVHLFQLAAISVVTQLLMGMLIHDAETSRQQARTETRRNSMTALVRTVQPARFATWNCLE